MKKIAFFLVLFVVSAMVWSQDLLPYKDEWTGKYGFMNQEGDVVVDAMFRSINPFVNGVSIVEKGRYEYQYVTNEGEIITFDQNPYELYNFSNEIGLVQDSNGKFFYINKSGKMLSELYQFAYPFSEGLAIVIIENKISVINASFEVLFELPVKPAFQDNNYGEQFSGGLLPIKNSEGKWGYIDNTGDLAIRPNFIYPGKFNGNYAYTRTEDIDRNEWIIIDKSGATISTVEIPNFDFPEYHISIYDSFIIFNPERGVVVIRDIEDGTEKEVRVSKKSRDFDGNVRPRIWNGLVLYDGSLINLDGEIVSEFNDGESEGIIWNEEYIFTEGKLYDINGNEYTP